MSIQNLNPFYWHIRRTKNSLKQNRIEKVRALQNREGEKLEKNKPPNPTKVDSQTPKKFFVYYSIAIRVQR
jgi:hypothetical protein